MRWIKKVLGILWRVLREIPFRRIVLVLWPVVGIMLVGFGAYLVYEPAGYIVVGLLMLLDMFHARMAARGRKATK
jgi:hypothetical protein